MAQNTLFDCLLARWEQDGVRRRPGVLPSEIAAFESRYAVRFPDDMCEYLLTVDGMEPGDVDDNLFSFWQLDRIRPITMQLPEPHYLPYRNFPGADSFFCFADWMFDADVFYLELSSDLTCRNRVIGFGPRYLPFDSFSAFVSAYLSDSNGLLADKPTR